MKNNIKNLTVGLIGIILGLMALSARAQTNIPSGVPMSVPLASEAKLKAYAYTLVTSIGGNIFGQSVSGNSSFYVKYTGKKGDPLSIRKLVKEHPLTPEIDPKEELFASLYYVGGVDEEIISTLFYGAKKFYAEMGENGYHIPKEAQNIQLEVSDWVPFKIKDLNHAYMVIRDEKGNVIQYYYFQDDGRQFGDTIFLGRSHLGHHGKLFAILNDGRKIGYDLTSGDLIPTVRLLANGFNATEKGTEILTDNTRNIIFNSKYDLYRVHYSVASRVRVVFPAGEEWYPFNVSVVDLEVLSQDLDADWENFSPFKPIEFSVQAGQTLFIAFDRDTILPYNGESGGGVKGSVE